MPPQISKANLRAAAKYLTATIRAQGALAKHVRIRQHPSGVFASATVNGVPLEMKMPYGIVAWGDIAQALIHRAEADGAVARVM